MSLIEKGLYLETLPEFISWERDLLHIIEVYKQRRGTWSQFHHLAILYKHVQRLPKVGDIVDGE